MSRGTAPVPIHALFNSVFKQGKVRFPLVLIGIPRNKVHGHQYVGVRHVPL